jgi:hypothetical protein
MGSHRDEETLVGLAPPAERRPEPVNPPPPESMRPPQPSADTGQIVVGRGKWTLSMPSAFALAALTSVAGAFLGWVNKPNAGDPAVIVAGWRAEKAKDDEQRKTVDAALTKRVEGVELEIRLMRQSFDDFRASMSFRNPLPPSPVDPLAAPMNKQLSQH